MSRQWLLRREGAQLTNGTEVEEEWQFSAAGQAGVGLAQLVEESVRACLQWRQPRHRCVFQQSGAEGDGLRWGARLKHLTGRGTNRLNQCFLGHLDPRAVNAALAQTKKQLQLCSLLLHQGVYFENLPCDFVKNRNAGGNRQQNNCKFITFRTCNIPLPEDAKTKKNKKDL